MAIFLGTTANESLNTATAERDMAAGYRDRMAGYYDKWYRYNRCDDGAAYDAGANRAVNTGKAPECCVIEVANSR